MAYLRIIFSILKGALKATSKAIKDLGYSIPGPWFLLTYSETLP